MSDVIKVEADELSQLARNMDRCYRNVCSSYERDINSIRREMESLLNRYSDYGNVVSAARGILSSLKEIEYKTREIEEHSQRLVTNTKQAAALYKESEYISKSIIDKKNSGFGKPIKISGSISNSSGAFKIGNQLESTYLEGGILYENINGEIYKNGDLISEKDYKYIPHEVGGLRVVDGKGVLARSYVENKTVYEQIGTQIYKNGVLVPEEHYKYIPKEIGGLRDTIGRGSYVMVSQTYIEGDNIYQRIGGVIYKNGKEIAVDQYKYIPKEIGGIREIKGNGSFAQGYKEGEHIYIKIGDIIYKNGKEVKKRIIRIFLKR